MGGDDVKPFMEIDMFHTNEVRTYKTTFKTTFKWKIKGFNENSSSYNHDGIKSRVFVIRGEGGRVSRWILEVKPGTIDTSPFIDAPVVVHLHSKNAKTTLNPQLCLKFVNSLNSDFGTVNKTQTFSGESSCELVSRLYWRTMLVNRWGHLSNGDLNMALDFTFESDNATLYNSYQKLSENFNQFFLSKDMSDIQVRCGDQTFDAHQLILSARSPVFRRMFENEMKEKKNKEVEIQDFDPRIVQEMLKFIYTGKCSVIDKDADPKLASELMKAGHMYQMDVLVEMCGDVLIPTLNPENALELLELSDMYRAQGLKTRALDKVVNHVETVRASDTWKECAKRSPHLFVAIAEAMADKIKSLFKQANPNKI